MNDADLIALFASWRQDIDTDPFAYEAEWTQDRGETTP